MKKTLTIALAFVVASLIPSAAFATVPQSSQLSSSTPTTGYVLQTTNGISNWVATSSLGFGTGGGGTPGGASSTVQVNCNGSFCGDGNLTWNGATLNTHQVETDVLQTGQSGNSTISLAGGNVLINPGFASCSLVIQQDGNAPGNPDIELYVNGCGYNLKFGTPSYFAGGNVYILNSATAGASTANFSIGTTSTAATFTEQAIAGLNQLLIASSTGSTTFAIDNLGHIVTGGKQPTVSGGSSSIGAPSNDNSGFINVAGTALTSVTLTFAYPWAKTPACTESDNVLVTAADISSVSTTTLVIGFGTGGVTTATVWYQCSQPN